MLQKSDGAESQRQDRTWQGEGLNYLLEDEWSGTHSQRGTTWTWDISPSRYKPVNSGLMWTITNS